MSTARNPNPQGKGMVTSFALLDQNRASIAVPPKHIEQVSNEMFTAMFVLQSRFRFKPVVGGTYWLYREHERFKLSLIAPHEWSADNRQYIGECTLHPDMSWTLELGEQAADDAELMSFIEQQRRSFESAIAHANSLGEALPYYVSSLPFYQRVFASALACSLRDSMSQSGIIGLPYREAHGLLEQERGGGAGAGTTSAPMLP